jgi:hypothetical protein
VNPLRELWNRNVNPRGLLLVSYYPMPLLSQQQFFSLTSYETQEPP